VLQLVNLLIAPTALRARDWDGEQFVVETNTGASHRASNLSELWKVVQRLTGSPFDPLSLLSPASRSA
jgi:hypothetical protein